MAFPSALSSSSSSLEERFPALRTTSMMSGFGITSKMFGPRPFPTSDS